MEQKDYILREIEKIRQIISAIRQKLLKDNQNLAIGIETQKVNINELFLNELNIELEEFLRLNIEDSKKYLLDIKGFSVENIEMLADCISEIGFNNKMKKKNEYLEKALQLYELCGLESKTYSIEREKNKMKIKNAL